VIAVRGIVVEVKKNKMIILDGQGNYYRHKYGNEYRIGQEIDLDLPKESIDFKYIDVFINAFSVKKMALAFSILCAMIGLTYYGYTYPYSYVSVDINPSMEISLNIFERVVGIKPLNEDGGKIVEKISGYWNSDISETVDLLVYKAQEEKYLEAYKGNEIFITVTSSKHKSAEEIKDKIEKKIARMSEDKKISTVTEVEKVDISKRVDAQQKHISTGKLILYERLKATKPDLQIEEIKAKTVREIAKEIKGEIIKEKLRADNEKQSRTDQNNRIENLEENIKEKLKNNIKETPKEKLREKIKEDLIERPKDLPMGQTPEKLQEKLGEGPKGQINEEKIEKFNEFREKREERIKENRKSQNEKKNKP
jgi:hypothetical protein